MNIWAANSRFVAHAVIVLVLAIIITGISISPVLARDDRGHHGHDRYHGRAVYHGDRWYHGHRWYYWNGYYYYPAPVQVYAPPPAVYIPPPSPPGINFVFPLHVR